MAAWRWSGRTRVIFTLLLAVLTARSPPLLWTPAKSAWPWPIRPRLPFIHGLPSQWVLRLSHLATATPVLRHLGEILLFRAERPVRQPIEGIRRPGSKLAKRLFRWYMRKIGKPPLWEENEPV